MQKHWSLSSLGGQRAMWKVKMHGKLNSWTDEIQDVVICYQHPI